MQAIPEPSQTVLRAGETCWRIARADRVRVIIDAVEYFKQLRAAMLTARHSVMIVGWDFDTRIELDRDDADEVTPNEVGALIDKAVADNPGLQVYVLRWDLQFVKTPLRGQTPLVVLDWVTGERTHFKLDAHHPLESCHHQKLVVIDDALAFCGGIDITDGRWDTCQHLDDEPRRKGPAGNDNPPWHDATVAIEGAAAKALGDLTRMRWQAATGDALVPPPAGLQRWPATLEPDFRDVDMGIARTSPEYGDAPLVAEIQALYLAAIASARRNIYLESQYFSAPVIADAVAARLAEADGPDIVIVNPRTADGWLEAKFMDSARAVLLARLHAADAHGRLRFCTPVTAGGADIYVHAKVLVIDDRLLRVGSSNINKRSLATDTECDVAIEAGEAGNDDVRAAIARIRDALLAEHLGVSADAWHAALGAANGRLCAALDALMKPSGRTLVPFVAQPLDPVEMALAETQVNELGPESFAQMLADQLAAKLARPARRLVPWAALAAGLAAGAAAFARRRR